MSAAATNETVNEAVNEAVNGSANGAAKGAANGAANGTAKGPTVEKVQQHLHVVIHTLHDRMKRLLHGREAMKQEIATWKQGSNQTHRIQTLRQGRVINKGRRHTERILDIYMIFKHDVDLLLRNYTTLFTHANHLLAVLLKESVPTPPPWVIKDIDMINKSYARFHPVYSKIHNEHDVLLHMIDGKNSDNNQDNNHAKTKPKRKSSIRFTNSKVRLIPTREEIKAEEQKQMEINRLEALSASSLGGTRRKRTLRKKHIRRHQTRRRS